ncbi:hypothetical protein PEX1_042610 [Penicillium expansum]|uniref:NmrA-like domain-containing protein n=1 Tax=Penicillium expansum TaxID=27334 RepID=A0A0A2KB57_PENEN|nr:hypothetical protein PEX2_079370 [Penicillium expansum]KGO42288.1 hypothetical protein PEXP_052400 [Penicillium expansum]KGO56330.1 hypothetical protein PEX2_079370 [Penicillium expansum]KGO64106.1 hypothetical protein PEX1_042610 [Penicillium expansum]
MGVKIGVFPASGALGSSIVNHLAKLVPESDLILSARRPEKLHDLKQAGATVRRADYDDPSTLDTAFEGVDVLMLVSYASFEIDHRVKAHRLAIDAAIKRGVKYIFYSSLGFGGDLSDQTIAHVMGAHIETEKYLSSLQDKLSYTIVREGIYTESFPIYTAFFDPKNPVDEVAIPHSGSGPGVAWVKRDELGEATAKLISSYVNDPTSFEYLNKAVLFSGSREISLAESVEIIGRAIGKPLKIREISVDEYVKLPQIGDNHTYKGVNLSREWATAWEAIRRGEAAVVSPALHDILGREPESFETTIKALVR